MKYENIHSQKLTRRLQTNKRNSQIVFLSAQKSKHRNHYATEATPDELRSAIIEAIKTFPLNYQFYIQDNSCSLSVESLGLTNVLFAEGYFCVFCKIKEVRFNKSPDGRRVPRNIQPRLF